MHTCVASVRRLPCVLRHVPACLPILTCGSATACAGTRADEEGRRGERREADRQLLLQCVPGLLLAPLLAAGAPLLGAPPPRSERVLCRRQWGGVGVARAADRAHIWDHWAARQAQLPAGRVLHRPIEEGGGPLLGGRRPLFRHHPRGHSGPRVQGVRAGQARPHVASVDDRTLDPPVLLPPPGLFPALGADAHGADWFPAARRAGPAADHRQPRPAHRCRR